MNITITKTTHPGTLPPSDQLGFGTVFTDHMFLMDYSADKGWHDARVVPYGPITMSPAASVLHYGTEVFEGMKAYRRPDGGVQLFRPWENVARLNRSCERLGLPQLDPDDALQAIKTVVKVDENWVPSDPGTSLYIRPFLYGTDPTLALHGVHEATFAVILSPSGSYFAVISPIGELCWGDRDYKVNDNKIGALSQKLYDELTGIQWGTKPDPFGWVCPID